MQLQLLIIAYYAYICEIEIALSSSFLQQTLLALTFLVFFSLALSSRSSKTAPSTFMNLALLLDLAIQKADKSRALVSDYCRPGA